MVCVLTPDHVRRRLCGCADGAEHAEQTDRVTKEDTTLVPESNRCHEGERNPTSARFNVCLGAQVMCVWMHRLRIAFCRLSSSRSVSDSSPEILTNQNLSMPMMRAAQIARPNGVFEII